MLSGFPASPAFELDPAPTPLEVVLAYHLRSKHRLEAYARGPEVVDWDAPPAPFRRFEGAPVLPLPRRSPAQAPARPGLDALGALLRHALGITAWKSWGPDRWAVRANPSSGNLHPLEAYLLARGIEGLADGLYHYRPEDHVLECRAAHDPAPGGGAPALLLGLSTVMWREAWKYGERAFRYCQLDVGHGVAALAYAAGLLGWPLAEQRHVGHGTLAQLLGLDRVTDFPRGRLPDTEQEEAEILLSVGLDGSPPAPVDPAPWLRDAAHARWQGVASAIDPRPMYHWPAIAEAAHATRRADAPVPPAAPATAAPAAALPAASLLLARRSAQRFDGRHVLPRGEFLALLRALLPGNGVPWDALHPGAAINLLLFLHRVEGFAPGLYLLARDAAAAARLAASGGTAMEAVEGLPPGLDLRRLATLEPTVLARLTRAVHCHQELAAGACLALGMIAEFDAVLAVDPPAYRDLHRQAGMLGQALYLQAEALGLRGTGIGCFFDDPVGSLLGLEDMAFQSLYHFTLGRPVEDSRIETTPPYPESDETPPTP